MIRYKSATVSAEWFDCSSSPTYKKYLPLKNQLHFWTGHIQSIVKVKNKLEVQAAIAKLDGGLFFSNSVSRMVRLNGPVPFFKKYLCLI